MKNKSMAENEKFANEVIKPIMDKIHEVAFTCIETYKGDSDEPINIPLCVNEGVLETLDEVIEHCESQAGWADGASIIGFALGKDGLRPGRRYRSMAKIAIALRDLIKAKNDQLEEEKNGMREHEGRERMAAMLGF